MRRDGMVACGVNVARWRDGVDAGAMGMSESAAGSLNAARVREIRLRCIEEGARSDSPTPFLDGMTRVKPRGSDARSIRIPG